MTLNDAIINCSDTDECEIDIEKAIKLFTDRCFISRWHEEYFLLRIKNKKCRALKVSISKKDALKLIEKLGLNERKSEIFNNAYTYELPSYESNTFK